MDNDTDDLDSQEQVIYKPPRPCVLLPQVPQSAAKLGHGRPTRSVPSGYADWQLSDEDLGWTEQYGPRGVPFYQGWQLYRARGLNKRTVLYAFGSLNLVDPTTRGLLKKASTLWQEQEAQREQQQEEARSRLAREVEQGPSCQRSGSATKRRDSPGGCTQTRKLLKSDGAGQSPADGRGHSFAEERPSGDHSPAQAPHGDNMVASDSQEGVHGPAAPAEEVSQPLVTCDSDQQVLTKLTDMESLMRRLDRDVLQQTSQQAAAQAALSRAQLLAATVDSVRLEVAMSEQRLKAWQSAQALLERQQAGAGDQMAGKLVAATEIELHRQHQALERAQAAAQQLLQLQEAARGAENRLAVARAVQSQVHSAAAMLQA